MVTGGDRPYPGWHMLELSISCERPEETARLYVDYGRGFSEADSFTLQLKADGLAKRLVHFRRRPRRLRLDPAEHAGALSIDTFRLIWLMPWFARQLLARRLSLAHPAYQGMMLREVLPQLRAQAKAQRQTLARFSLTQYEETFRRFSTQHDYQKWLEHNTHDAGGPERSRAEALMRRLSKRAALPSDGRTTPLFSVLVAVYDPDPAWLRECFDSVVAQTFPDWELCVADDASTDPRVRGVLDEYAATDNRIRLVYRSRNGHISAASNTALEMATGDFVALLDHDDRLAPNALLCVAETIDSHPDVQLLYSDEDKISASGERFDPHFKPRWNPDLALAQNYVSHLGVYRRDRVLAIGGFREGFEGSQDHDLLLRFTKGLSAARIHHIPHVLYHWRAVAGSTAVSESGKDYAARSGLRSVSDYLAETEPMAAVEPGPAPNRYRVRWPRPEPAPLVSLIIPTRDGIEILRPCVDGILERTDYPAFEILVVDNDSRCPETLAYLEELKAHRRVRVLEWHEPFNYSAINNYAATHADGEVIGLINNDIEPINNDWLDEMVRQAVRPEIGCVGAKLYYPNERIQHAGVILGLGGLASHSHKHFPREHPGYFYRLQLVQNLTAVTGACLVMRRSIFDAVGGLDEVNLPVAFNDVDLCLRVREAGYWNLWTPYAEAYHHESVSRGGEDTAEKRRRFAGECAYMRRRWRHWIDDDPAYNPNLTRNAEDFSLNIAPQ